ncbi:hypothetical protein [Lacticaseibacillus nasuensis]|uniref:hypothetical protein n=1 Tax=Lacticaseibacillus nasuensis TaxID=944671 RepID=UPI000ACCAB5D|nr:hypothetical protein [Lacticaseibacillus nasuensis]
MYQAYSGNTAVELTTNSGRDANVPFSILQIRSDCQLKLERQTASLRAGDIALIRAEGPVTLEPLTPAGLDARLFIQPLPSDAVYGPNTIINSLLKTRDTAHVIFRRIAHNIIDAYCDQLVRLAAVTPQDALVEYEQSMIAHLLITELSRADLNAMMIIESDFPETDLRSHRRIAKRASS